MTARTPLALETHQAPSATTQYLHLLQPEEKTLLGKVARETFTQTFQGLMTDETFNAYMETKLTDAELDRQVQEADNAFFLVKLPTGEAVGFVRVVYPSDKFFNHAPAHVKLPKKGCLLDRFYFLNSTHGSGLARACMQEVFEYAKGLGAEMLHLSTWEKNVRAQRFYEKVGYTHAFSAPFDVGNGLINQDYVYIKRLG